MGGGLQPGERPPSGRFGSPKGGAKKALGQYQPVILLEMNSRCLIAVHNRNPRFFLESLLGNFPFVFWVKPSAKLRRISKGIRRPNNAKYINIALA